MRKNILAAMLITTSLMITGCGQVNIGYVDGQKIVSDAPQIKAIIEESKQKLEEVETEAMAEMEKNPNWTDEEKMKAQGDIQRKIIGINQAYTTQLRHKLDEALSEISKQKNLDAVIDSSKDTPIVLRGGIDLTDEVIKKLQ